MEEFYYGRLPHWQREGAPLFLTWHLYGSLPRYVCEKGLTAGEAFLKYDQSLHHSSEDKLLLKNPLVADIVADTILAGKRVVPLYNLYVYVVMANHVHILLYPHARLRQITQYIKGATARAANQLLQRPGHPFWQRESYDHWVRSEAELHRISRYIEYNPVKAGLVEEPHHYPHSSAYYRPPSPPP